MLTFRELVIVVVLCTVSTAVLTRPTVAFNDETVKFIQLKGVNMKRYRFNPWTYYKRQLGGPISKVEASNYKILDIPRQTEFLSQMYENSDKLPRLPGKRTKREIPVQSGLRSSARPKNQKIKRNENHHTSRTTVVEVTPEFIVYRQFNKKKHLFGRGTTTDTSITLANSTFYVQQLY